MRIRSITFFYNPNADQDYRDLDKIWQACRVVRTALIQSGYEVQTTRLATNPFPTLLKQADENYAVEFALKLEEAAVNRGFNYLAIGPALISHPRSYEWIYPILAATHNTFLSAEIATHKNGISLAAIHSCAQTIRKAASISPDGFANLRFAALGNPIPMGPFFPSSFHNNQKPSFALAIETAGAGQGAVGESKSIQEARCKLLAALEDNGRRLTQICEANGKALGIDFCGIDFSLAPFPSADCSIARTVENLGVSRIGQLGSTAAAAILAETLDQGTWKKAGFNGLMFPVLEDRYLAEASIMKSLSIKDLLLFSTVCGTGLDTVPLPGDISAGSIAAILLDVAALSLRLDKPLTARLMPVPGKKAGDITEYDFEYFENGGILDVPSDGLTGLFDTDESIPLNSRRQRQDSQGQA